MNSDPPRRLILGLGNDLLGDDAVGLHIVRALRPHLLPPPPTSPLAPTFEIAEAPNAGLALFDEFPGFDEVVIIDAVQTGRRPAGYLHRIDASTLSPVAIQSPHFLGIPETLELGRELGLPMPRRVTLFAIEVTDPYTLSTQLSPPVAQALPRILKAIAAWLRNELALAQTAATH